MPADDLIGLWDSAPFDYGSMESSKLALLPDGTGWGEWANAAGGMELILLDWRLAEDGTLEITGRELFSGRWESSHPGHLVHAKPPLLVGTTDQYRYQLVESPSRSLKLAEPLLFTDEYAFVRREITVADRPSVDQPG